MKGRTNNPNGRPTVDEESKRKMVSFRLPPKTIAKIKDVADVHGMSQSDVIIRLVEDL